MTAVPSASQTVGPFFNFALTADPSLGIVAGPEAEGERIRLKFRVVDGCGEPTPGDSLIEVWQADAQGRYRHPMDPLASQADPAVRGFGRLETAVDGTCVFETVKPGPISGGVVQAPHVNVLVFARGLLKPLHTRVYFDGEMLNASDKVLSLVPDDRRATLLAKRLPEDAGSWFLEIRLQGDPETVFFDV